MDAFIKHEGISAFQLFIITSHPMIFKTIINNINIISVLSSIFILWVLNIISLKIIKHYILLLKVWSLVSQMCWSLYLVIFKLVLIQVYISWSKPWIFGPAPAQVSFRNPWVLSCHSFGSYDRVSCKLSLSP